MPAESAVNEPLPPGDDQKMKKLLIALAVVALLVLNLILREDVETVLAFLDHATGRAP